MRSSFSKISNSRQQQKLFFSRGSAQPRSLQTRPLLVKQIIFVAFRVVNSSCYQNNGYYKDVEKFNDSIKRLIPCRNGGSFQSAGMIPYNLRTPFPRQKAVSREYSPPSRSLDWS